MKKTDGLIIGAGMSGLAFAISSGLPIFEARNMPGGICSSYYVKPGETERLYKSPPNGDAYRFEIGGGHWIFGGDPFMNRFISSFSDIRKYTRDSAVYFSEDNLFVQYPLQNNIRFLHEELIEKILIDIVNTSNIGQSIVTMKDWIESSFGNTLSEIFFNPFHRKYTAGLWNEIAPQDPYKSPINVGEVIRGAFREVGNVGYNKTFIYPVEGLDKLARGMASQCRINYGMEAIDIDTENKIVQFSDGSKVSYKYIISTMPLDKMMEISKLSSSARMDPANSVLVMNIGAEKGENCPKEHWLYIPDSKSNIHRVGFYSNVDDHFLPLSSRNNRDRVSVYVEQAFLPDRRPTESQLSHISNEAIRELQSWGWIKEPEVIDPTWIDVAYTWRWPNSNWKEKSIKLLRENDIYQIGRYAEWNFQGISKSIRRGLSAGASFNMS